MTISDLWDPVGRDVCHFQTKAPEVHASDLRLEDAGATRWQETGDLNQSLEERCPLTRNQRIAAANSA